MRSLFIILTFLLAGLGVFQKSALALSPYEQIKSVTFYDFPLDINNEQMVVDFESALPSIKSNGFNTVWLVLPWWSFNPKPLTEPPVYTNQTFTNLASILRSLKNNNMYAILPLNYLGQGWSPEGIDHCQLITNPTMYNSFERYVREFLTRISEYSDLVYILFFTEGLEPCSMNPYADAEAIASLLRPTIGSLPTRLPPTLRNKFRIGYHDYSLINLGWAHGQSPIADPISYDFLSMVAFIDPQKTTLEITSEINARASRFKNLYPSIPLVIGESGANDCDNEQNYQALVIQTIATTAINNHMGVNFWGWKPINAETNGCTLGLTNPDGTPKKSLVSVKSIFLANTLFGDVNLDGKVNILDTRKVISNFLDIRDLNFVVGNFGK